MMILIPIFVLATVSIVILVVTSHWNNKHEDFVRNHSVALRALREINSRYNFYTVENSKFEQTYDNEHFFSTISCKDYLIYQLQFKKREITEQLKKIVLNNQKHVLYKNEINKISGIGVYDANINDLDKSKLIKIEQKLFSRAILCPQLKFHIQIVLRRTKINGDYCERKVQSFNEEEICYLIKRIENKSGSYFNDKGIWDAICRVERGRVSNKLRFFIYERDKYRCRYCGASGQRANLEIDHIIPIAKGGKSTPDNLQTLCQRCNKNKGANLPY